MLRCLGQVAHHGLHLLVTETVEGRHAASSLTDDACDLLVGEDSLDAPQGRNRGWGPGAIDAVTTAALVLVNALTQTSRRWRNRQADEPGGVIGVDVQHSRRGVNRGATPLSAPGKSRHIDGELVHAGRNELATADHAVELLHGPGMRLGRAVG